MSIDYTEYETLDHPRTITRFVIGSVVVALLFTLAAAMPSGMAEPSSIRGVEDHCKSSACLSPQQIIGASEALRTKRRLGSHALLVDIRAKAEAPAGLAMGSDAEIPFMEVLNTSGMEFQTDFGHRVDEALRAAHMGHDEPVIIMSPSTERSVLAALLLQERGYSGVLVMRH